MFKKMLYAMFGSRNKRLVQKTMRTVAQINALEAEYLMLTPELLLAKTRFFRQQYQAGVSLEEILPAAFAAVREAGKRTLGMRHFDVQLMGGIFLHQGKIAEMSTGEGKTLMATLPVYLNALTGKTVHLVTVNDYLVCRDAEWMRPLYAALGLSVGTIVSNQTRSEKISAYAADVVCATNNELGFDYLRDRMVYHSAEQVQGPLSFAIIDEVDSILIDEARTPLVISGAMEDSSSLYTVIEDRIIHALQKGTDYTIDEKAKQAFLTEVGHAKVEQLLSTMNLLNTEGGLYDPVNINIMHHISAALRAHALFRKDIDYIVTDGLVVIIDEHTGRSMSGRRWSDGLHQAVEAKEKVEIQQENQTLASITFQNFFRLYGKLAGMTGTADTEAYEFQQIYGLEVVVVPPNQTCARIDHSDLIYLTAAEKFQAIIEAIKSCQSKQQPVLVGTISIEASEHLSLLLHKEGIAHNVLNAKYHAEEARIIAEAGRPSAVTIATNMAGRGTDIVLGGSERDATWQTRHETVLCAGGLHILGTERHESRRIDNQLRGRAGRQGDKGSSQFCLSLEDNLMRIFASDRLSGIMRKLGVTAGEAITHPWVTRAIENAQRKVEGHHFDIRKQLLQYDDVISAQRQIIYKERDILLHSACLSDNITEIQQAVVSDLVEKYLPKDSIEELWDIHGLEKALVKELNITAPVKKWIDNISEEISCTIEKRILELLNQMILDKKNQIGSEEFHQLEKSLMLHAIDGHWKMHLTAMDSLRQSIHLRGYAQKDPKQEYKREAFDMFNNMLYRVKRNIIGALAHMHIQSPNSDRTQPEIPMSAASRNELCPCGSQKKFKHCHGVLR